MVMSSLYGIVLLVASLQYTTSAGTLDCYQCIGIHSSADCHSVVICPDDHVCFAERSGSGNATQFVFGCRASELCLTAPIVGRRSERSLMTSRGDVCSKCCSTDACNKHVCDRTATTAPPSSVATTPQFTPVTSIATSSIVSPTHVSTITTSAHAPAQPQCDTSGGYMTLKTATGQHTACILIRNDVQPFKNARDVCNETMGDLVVLENKEVASTLRQLLVDTNAQHSYWIGARDFFNVDEHIWVNNNTVDLNNGEWQPGQPNHFDAGHIQNCVTLWRSDNFLWHDDRCDKHLGFICERPMTM